MHLTRLEAHGFKSFAHRIVFDFHPGVTGIVGPNGCGKSNVVDAIKWALGDMSLKSLRGDEMLDVIFKGAAGVAPMGFAEVSLTFENGDRYLPIEFDEVTITRRLHRTGESEYLLNKAPCRLKDIRELFYGTGLGRDSYSIIEQGDINFLVHATPTERRAFFEEAAGISLYKARRREAESKLERVGQDLEVLGVQVREIGSEIRSLKIHAGRAERYRQHQEEVRAKRLALALHEYHGRLQALEAERAGLAALEADRAKAAASLAEAQAAAAAAEAEAHAQDEALAALQQELMAVTQREAALDESLRHEEARQGELSAERDRIAAEQERQAAATRQTEERLAAARAAADQARAEAGGLRERLAESEHLLAQADAACAEARAAIEGRKGAAIEALRKRAGHQNALVERQAERRFAAARREKVGEQQTRLEADHAAVRDGNAALSAELDRTDRAIAEAKAELEAEEAREQALRDEVSAFGEACDGHREARERALARRDLLRDLEARQEGLGTGARALLSSPDHGGAPFPGICGTVADALRVDPTHVRAIENLLGERAGWLVAETAVQALAAVDHVRGRGLGWVGVVPRNVRAGGAAPAPGIPEGARPAEACVQAGDADAAVARFFLGGTWIVSDRDAAVAFLRAAPPGAGVVTLDGQVFGPEGMIGGGARENAVSFLSRRAELASLPQELAAIADKLDAQANLFAEREADLVRLRERARALHYRIYDLHVEAQKPRTRLEEGRKHEDVLAREIAMNRQELGQLEAQDAFLADQERSLAQVLQELEALAGALEGEARDREGELVRYESARAEVQRQAADLRLALGNAEVRREAAVETASRLEEALAEAQAADARLAGRLADGERRLAEGAQACGRTQEALAETRRGRGELEERHRAADGARAAVLARLQEQKEREAAAAGRDRTLEQEIGARRLQEQEHVMRMEHLAQTALEECGADLRQAHADYRPPDGFDAAAVQQVVAELRRKMEAMGNVNLAAIDDLKAREERLAWLDAQQQDLLKAKGDLEELIRKINRESRERFRETIEKVRENFKGLFRKLFGGGNADLVLEEGADVLDAGIDIVAKPPHKDFTSLNLLSGGEKTLTTLALVLAIFQAKPSPFCLLDEADAALDEKNVDRYAALVREFAQSSQFLLITHNKRTMTAGDVLYGVTMQTPGVSKRVAVNLEEVETDAGGVRGLVGEPALAGAAGPA